MGENSFLRDPRKQILIVAFVFLVWYAIQVVKTGGLSYEDLLRTGFAFLGMFYGLLGISFLAEDVRPWDLMPDNVKAIMLDSAIFVFIFLLALGFFAQFVLPLHDVPERWNAFLRLINYVFRRHGPAISINNGVPKFHSSEFERRGPGVILLDTSSAAVLRTPTKFTRAVGPGTVFTGRDESIANAFSLHRQSKLLGPLPGENPFTEQQEEETDQEYKQRIERRWETRGTTRDDIEIVPTIVTVFQLNNEPNEGRTRFGYNAKTIWKANGREGIDPSKGDDTRQRKVRWDWLPAYMAAELWREYLGKYTFSELFAKPNELVDETAYQRILKYINLRLTNSRVEHLNDFGKRSGFGKITSPEYMRLQERGLKVIATVVIHLNFPDEVENRFLDQWRDKWVDKAGQERMHAVQLRSEKRMEGEAVALKEFGEYASKLLGDYLIQNTTGPHDAPDLSASLELMVRGTLDKTVDDPFLRSSITNEKQDLVDLIEWIRRN
jgi:hypothetical protein